MGLMDRITAQTGVSAPQPRRLRVVTEAERQAPVTRTSRPEELATFVGQGDTVFALSVLAEDALMTGQVPDHVLLTGPPGTGKTSLSRALAAKLGYRFVEAPASSLQRVNDVAAALSEIGEVGGEPVLMFVDELHSMSKKGITILLSAMEDRFFQVGGSERIELAEFVLVAASSNPGQLPKALRDRFAVVEQLGYYETDEIATILRRYADQQSIKLEDGVADLIAGVGRGVPRIASGLLRRVATFSRVGGAESVTLEDATEALERLGVDPATGLERPDRAFLEALAGQSTPVGLAALAATLDTDTDTLEMLEGYLLRSGWLRRTSRGRVLSRSGYKAIGQRSPIWTPA